MSVIRSRDNERLRRWRKLAASGRARRAEGRAMIEGVHLVAACLASGRRPAALIVSESGLARAEIAALVKASKLQPVVLADALFAALADTETPAGMAAEIAIPEGESDLAAASGCVFLDGVQDAGNVGAILRSAAAFAAGDVVLAPGCADAWSPKVLRAGMGAHFVLRIGQSNDMDSALDRFGGTIVCAVVRGGTAISKADLRGRIGWIFGGEGQGVGAALAARAQLSVTIPMPGATESLNVAAAAAICFYERARQLSTPAARG
ncbi:MAG: RNA methyltransferase [Betaproteobacteria bacterium]|nr:MAG: RNA methyltransferase [Betaproteobacteria bacterium]